jgi:hypothetical protein
MRRDGICICVSPANRVLLEAIIADGNSKSKPCVWRWQERCIKAGIDGLLCDKTRPLGRKPLPSSVRLKVLAKYRQRNTYECDALEPAFNGGRDSISSSSVGRICAEAGLKPHLVRRSRYGTIHGSKRR